jgi:CheY-like chemotaxis protein
MTPTRGRPPVVWILLACDRVERQTAFQAILEGAGFGVEFTDNGEPTVQRAKEQHYDLILLDLQSQITEGLRAAAAIREIEGKRGQLETPIMAILGRSVSGSEQYCLALGMNLVLHTPVPTVRFVRQIKELVSMREHSAA